MTEKQVAIRRMENLVLTPAEVVENATMQARFLMDIVEKTKCYQVIGDKKYLQVEAWETIGAFNRTHSQTAVVIPILREGEVIGYQAHVELWKDGEKIGGAIMPCYFTEPACRGKEGDAKHKACMSAAQTFATSKAYRMNFAYVAILAGYQPLPSEEIDEPQSSKEHWCTVHNTEFFKRGKMPRYAHPTGDTGKWCNEPESAADAQVDGDIEQIYGEGSVVATKRTSEPPQPSKAETSSPTLVEPARRPSETMAGEPEKGVENESGGDKQHVPSFKTLGDLFTACAKIRTSGFPKGVSRQVALNIWAIKEEELARLNLNDAWQQVLDHVKIVPA